MKYEEKTLTRDSKFKGNIFEVAVDEVLLPDGKTSRRELIFHRGAVAVLAVTPEGKLVIVKQYRKAIEDVSYEIPAGKLEVGELTEANALRMHQTTSTANPPFSYLTDASYQAMDKVKALRASGEQCYFTMDAGPNVKVQVTPTTTQKSKMVAGLLAFFLRPFYFFYIGNNGTGVLHLFIAALGLFPPLLVVNLIWNIVLGIMIFTSKPGTKYHQDALGNELLD